MNVVVYTDDGAIVRHLSMPEEMLEFNLEEGDQYIEVEDSPDLATHYVDVKKKKLMPCDPFGDKAKPTRRQITAGSEVGFMHLPEDTLVIWPDGFQEVIGDDEAVVGRYNEPGEYTFRFFHPRYIDQEVTVHVV